tara:strand:+ start:284 stop:673 length:390 start_codon:yes stop_codon:yes gene_type:complete
MKTVQEKDKKLDLSNLDQDFWGFSLGGYTDTLYGEMLILDISQDDLMNKDDSNIEEIGRVEYGNWDALRGIIPDEDINLEKEESETYLKELRDGCDCGDEICECEYVICRTLLYCENEYVYSAAGYSNP